MEEEAPWMVKMRRMRELVPSLPDLRRLIAGEIDGPVAVPDDVIRALGLSTKGGMVVWREPGRAYAQANGRLGLGGGYQVRWGDLEAAILGLS